MGLLLHTWKCFQGFCFLPPFIPAGSRGSANFSPQRLRREGPVRPEPPLGGALWPWRRAERARGLGCEDADSRDLRGLGTDAGVGSLPARDPSSYPCPHHVPGRREQQLQSNGCTGDASTLDAPGGPPSGDGERKPGGDDYREPRRFPLRSGNLGGGLGRRWGAPAKGLGVTAQPLASRPWEGTAPRGQT